mgnify:CR=1 FL=1
MVLRLDITPAHFEHRVVRIGMVRFIRLAGERAQANLLKNGYQDYLNVHGDEGAAPTPAV